ncbi:MAG: hypothetical protein ACLFVJ_17105 [Persicimonas sp.]
MLDPKLRSSLVLICAVMLLVVGCGSDTDTDEEQTAECEVTEDCDGAETCVDGACVEPSGEEDAGAEDGGDTSEEDASEGPLCSDDEWEDDGQCRSCPAADLTCSDVVLGDPPGDSYFWSGAATMSDSLDPRIVLTLDADPAAIESARLDVTTITTSQVGDLPKEVTREATVDGAELTFAFDPDEDWHSGNPSRLEVVSLELTDTCGHTDELPMGGSFSNLSTDRQYGFECPPAE